MPGNFNDKVLSIRVSPHALLTVYQHAILTEGGWAEPLDNSQNNASRLFVLDHSDGSSFTLAGSGSGIGSLSIYSGQKAIAFTSDVGANGMLASLTNSSPVTVGANIYTSVSYTHLTLPTKRIV